MQTEVHLPDDTTDLQYDAANDRYVTEYDPDGTATLLSTLVHAVTGVVDVDVSQGEFSLYDSVDPDALERIFAKKPDGSPRMGGHVAFTALDCEVYVYADGVIHIYPPAAPDQSTQQRR